MPEGAAGKHRPGAEGNDLDVGVPDVRFDTRIEKPQDAKARLQSDRRRGLSGKGDVANGQRADAQIARIHRMPEQANDDFSGLLD
ncbi:hypothetical protein [Phenylobacterium kunshanense]|uniref:hypothetical protein n=1 Tax=Phenylobacterium kunshanense TaxID=1445034 RepID=UPI001404265F|nr:hypothetical protein [Phenylobacterium kunshanense]